MANFTQGDTRPVLQPADLTRYQSNGSVVLDTRRTRPLWFDGRFLAARDLLREQNYFLQRQADLGRSPGFGVLNGMLVRIVSSDGQSSDIVTIGAGSGITPAGEQVQVPSDLTIHLSSLTLQANLELKLGIASEPTPAPAKRTGLFAIALQPVQFSANPITAYPTTIQGARSTHDGDIVEATSITLVPYPDPVNSSDGTVKQAALARQIFLSGSGSQLPDSLLPLALVSLQNGTIQWLDTYMLRRESGTEYSGVRFGLTDPAAQQAFLQQYDSQLQQTVNTFLRQNMAAKFAAADQFQALPPAGRFPLACINTDGFTQLFFPPQMDVRLSVIPEDEIPVLIEQSMSLPPIDLTLPAASYNNLTVFALIPVPRSGFQALANGLPQIAITATLPQVLSSRQPIDLLRFYQGATGTVAAPAAANNVWQSAIGTQTYGFYIRRQSSATPVQLAIPPAPTTTTAAPTTTTAAPPPTQTATPTTTTAAPTTTTAAPTTTAKPTSTTNTTTTTPKPTTTLPPTTTTLPPTTTTLPPTTTTPKPTTTTPKPTTTLPTTTTTLRLTTPITTLTLRPPLTINPIITNPVITDPVVTNPVITPGVADTEIK